MRRFALPIALAAALATPLSAQQAQDPPTFWNLVSLDRIGKAIAGQVLLSARAFADIQYQDLRVDMVAGRMAIVGLQVTPPLQGVAPGACTVRADRAVMRGAPFDQIETMRIGITLTGAVVDFDCLPPEIRPVVGMLGVTDIAVDRLDLTVDYDMPSGAATVQMQAGVDGLLRVIADAEVDYLSYRMNLTTEQPDPSILLRHARVQIEDLGLSARSEQMLPPQMREPEVAAATVRDALTGMLGQGAPLNPAQQQLVTDAGTMAAAIMQGGTRVTLETTIATPPLRIDGRTAEDPATLITALAPRLSADSQRLTQAVPRDLLVAAIENRLPDAERMPVGRALLTGVGAPRNRTLAAEILFPLVQQGNAEAAHMLAEAFETVQPQPAYRDAIAAVAAGRTQALALLERIEDTLPFDVVMQIQGNAAPAALRDPTRFDTIADMRSAAFAHASGVGAPRSFETAYFWAAMAAAGGDSAADGLRADLDERMRLRGLADVWADRTSALDQAVLRGWIEADLATRLQRP